MINFGELDDVLNETERLGLALKDNNVVVTLYPMLRCVYMDDEELRALQK